MKDYCEQLAALAMLYKAKIVYAGDIFHSWKEPAELINFLLSHLPKGYAIPGQHDLPYHRLDDVGKSPYWSLVMSGAIEDLGRSGPTYITPLHQAKTKIALYPFPWGVPVKPLEDKTDRILNVAVIHAYCWREDMKYEGAPKEQSVHGWSSRLYGYHVAVFGDNHKGFSTYMLHEGHHGPCTAILNNGCFIRRRQDEKDYQPCVGLVYSDGTVERVPLDTSKDRWTDVPDDDYVGPFGDLTTDEVKKFVDVLNNAREQRVDFATILLRSLDDAKLGSIARKLIIQVLEDSK